MGQMFAKIRDERLYREHYSTFEVYCQGRWGIKRDYAYKLIDAAAVYENLYTIGYKTMPVNESQTRLLKCLTTDEQHEVWQKVNEAERHVPTAKEIQEIINSNYPEKAGRKSSLSPRNKSGDSTDKGKVESDCTNEQQPTDTTASVTHPLGKTGPACTSDEGNSSSSDVTGLTPNAINPGTDQNQACCGDSETVSPLEADSPVSLKVHSKEIQHPLDEKKPALGFNQQTIDESETPTNLRKVVVVEQETPTIDGKFTVIPNSELPQTSQDVEVKRGEDESTPFLLADGSELPPTSLAVGWISHEEMLSTTALLTTTNKTKSKIEMDAGTFLQRLQIEIASLLNRVLGVNPSYSDLHNADDALTTIRRKITAHSNYHRKPTK